jgi:hypothetical protein
MAQNTQHYQRHLRNLREFFFDYRLLSLDEAAVAPAPSKVVR